MVTRCGGDLNVMTMCLYHSSRCDIVVTRCGGDLNVMTMCLYHSSRLS